MCCAGGFQAPAFLQRDKAKMGLRLRATGESGEKKLAITDTLPMLRLYHRKGNMRRMAAPKGFAGARLRNDRAFLRDGRAGEGEWGCRRGQETQRGI